MTVRSELSPPHIPPLRLALAVRYLLLTGVLVGAVGIAGRFLAWPLLTSTVGPTAYVFAAHPRTEAARFRNALVGHGVAIACGLGALAAFGLVRYPSITETGSPSAVQVAAAVFGVALTVFFLELAGSHHAPSAATALLITTGLAKPGAPLIGLVLGLAIVIALGPLIGRIPFARNGSSVDQPRRLESHTTGTLLS
jgi:HPP family